MGPILDAGGVTTGVMKTGAWMLDAEDRPCAGALGVLIDDTFGYVVVLERPSDQGWAVSTEISIDFPGPLPVDGSLLRAEGRLVELNARAGLSRGRVVDGAGRTVAIGTQRSQFVTRTPSLPLSPASPPSSPAGVAPGPDASPRDLLRKAAWRREGGPILELSVTPEMVNPMEALHGGILLWGSEIVGLEALRGADRPLATAAIRIAYVRPGPGEGAVTFRAEVLHLGRTFGVAQVTSYNPAGKKCGIATVTAYRPS